MRFSHENIRLVLDHETYKQFSDHDGGMDNVNMYYEEYLEHDHSFNAPERVYAEFTWHQSGGRTIFMTGEDVDGLLAVSKSAIENKTLPPLMPSIKKGCFCYEFPPRPMLAFGLYFRLYTMQSLLIVNDIEDYTLLWQGENDFVMALTLTPEEIMSSVNMRINIAPEMMTLENFDRIPQKELMKLERKRMVMIVYHLCHGLGIWRQHMRNSQP